MDAFKKKLMLEIAITLIMIAALGGGILFFRGKIVAYSDTIISLRKELDLRSRSLNSFAMLRSEYNARAKRDFQALYLFVPLKDQLINLSREYQSLAFRSGIDNSFSFVGESPASADNFGTVRFRLDLGGDFNKLADFIGSLERFRYLSTYDGFSLTRGDKSRMDTRGQVYYREGNGEEL